MYFTAVHIRENSAFSDKQSDTPHTSTVSGKYSFLLTPDLHTEGLRYITGLHAYLSPANRMSSEKKFIVVTWSSAQDIQGSLTHFPRFYRSRGMGSLRTSAAFSDSPRNTMAMWEPATQTCHPLLVITFILSKGAAPLFLPYKVTAGRNKEQGINNNGKFI